MLSGVLSSEKGKAGVGEVVLVVVEVEEVVELEELEELEELDDLDVELAGAEAVGVEVELLVLDVVDMEEKVEEDELALLEGAIIPIAKYPPIAATTMTTTPTAATAAFPMASRLRFELSGIITVESLLVWKVAFDLRELAPNIKMSLPLGHTKEGAMPKSVPKGCDPLVESVRAAWKTVKPKRKLGASTLAESKKQEQAVAAKSRRALR